jgi:hypothetical protein
MLGCYFELCTEFEYHVSSPTWHLISDCHKFDEINSNVSGEMHQPSYMLWTNQVNYNQWWVLVNVYHLLSSCPEKFQKNKRKKKKGWKDWFKPVFYIYISYDSHFFFSATNSSWTFVSHSKTLISAPLHFSIQIRCL